MAMQMKSENGTERVISDLNVNVATTNSTTASKKRSGDEFKGLFSRVSLDIIDLFPSQQILTVRQSLGTCTQSMFYFSVIPQATQRKWSWVV